MLFLSGLLTVMGAISAIQATDNEERRAGLLLVGAGILCGIAGAVLKV